ncbi:hypothetical protein HDZ31DRAFT_30661 [Schizophyllum fasciatum]
MPLQPESVANIAVSGNAGPGLDPVHVWKMPSAASIPPQSFTPPIATLPTELLAEIFLCATPLYLWDAKPNAEPLVISQVCRNWRFIAIHLPGLWRRLSLTGCTSRSTHHRLDLAKTYMSRSMHMGMSISYRDTEALTVISKIWKSAAIRGREASEAPAEGRCHCVLDLIIARIGEVHTLDLVIGHVSSLRLSVVPPATASMLKHLSVRFYEGGNHTQALSCFYASLPQLEHLKWGNYLKACRVPHPTGAPWSELVTANIADCRTTHEAFLQIMHSGQRLQAVTVRLLSAARLTAPSTLIQVKQNVLEMLTICGDGPIDAVFFALQLPSLRSLTLRSTAREGSIWPFSDIQALHHCILGIEGGLNSFTMTRAESINEGDLIATLALPQMATLRNLDVHIPLLSDGFFTKLNPEYGPPLVSCLDRLNVANCATTDETISPPCPPPLASGGCGRSGPHLPTSHWQEDPLEPSMQSHPTLPPPRPSPAAIAALPDDMRTSLEMLLFWQMPSAASIPPRSSVGSSGVPPINTLPPEVLSQIFLRTMPLQLWEAKPESRSVLLRLTHVCRYWRGVAIDFPDLWRCISLTGCENRHTHRRLDLAKTYMDRTRGLGIDIYYQDIEEVALSTKWWQIVVRGGGLTVAPSEDRCFCVLDMIIARIGEIRTLEIVIGHASSARLSAAPATAAIMLKRLTVRFLEGGERTQALSRFCASLPQVEHLMWGNSQRVCAVPFPLGMPWGNLMTANVVDCPMTQNAFMDMLNQGQRLQEAIIRLTGASHMSEPSGRRQVHQNSLNNLTIYGDGPIDAVLIGLHLPVLRKLALRTDAREAHGWPFSNIYALQHCISNVHEGLILLMMTRAETVVEADLIATLALPQMSTLRHLDVDIPIVSDLFFRRLDPNHNIPLVPCLERLHMAECTTTDGVVTRMLLSRMQRGYPLRQADIVLARQGERSHAIDLSQRRLLQEYGVAVRGFY